MSKPYLDLYPKITERQFMGKVEQLAEYCGWWVWHDNDSRRNRAGWPDLVLLRPGRLIFAELKTDTGKLSAEQRRILSMLKMAGQEVYIWRPTDFETIRGILKR
jgi:hypothetical protein